MQPEPVSNGVAQDDSSEAGHQIIQPNNEEVSPSGPSGKHADLSLQIPLSPLVFDNSHNGKDLPPLQHSSKGSPALGRFLRGLSFKNKVAPLNGEGSSLLDQDPKEVPGSPVLESIIESLSWKRCTSLPVTPASNLSPSTSTLSKQSMGGEKEASHRPAVPAKVSRSLSVPVRNVVIVRSLSFANRNEPVQIDPSDDHTSPILMEDDDQEIPEEEAVCRICLVGLCEGGNTFKMECSCKGDLRLTHEECVVKWFCIKGNKNCDVCGQEVRNLPVSVLRVHSSRQRVYRRGGRQSSNQQTMSAWYDLVVLTLISSISYFFILEQLLISDLKSQAIVIAAPFSFSLGLLGSMFAIIVAIQEYIWTYAALEFTLVATSLHLCYSQVSSSSI
ncbi:zinc finger protein [Macleaya cordata]|uniref:Zinc finger protein n=1 Tax=Macleaya cordata TaxID=56857 RepID=A0A200QQ17_MACCD|nr:zinc finger protein [Macleaya cordata]